VAAWTNRSSLDVNQSRDEDPNTYSLKIARDLARAFLVQISLTLMPTDFLISGGESNHDVGGLFCLLGRFSSWQL
jgi:hypothetical protein